MLMWSKHEGATVPMVVFLLLVLTGGSATCGCWGSNLVYLHHKAPATGWYTLHIDKGIYIRNINISGDEVQYLLEYKFRFKYWALFERTLKNGINHDGEILVISNWEEEEIIVLCPSRCSCRKVSVEGSACWITNGNYIRSDILKKRKSTNLLEEVSLTRPMLGFLPSQEQQHMNSDVLRNVITISKQTEQPIHKSEIKRVNILKQSKCLLAELAKCMERKDIFGNHMSGSQKKSEEEGCEQYTKVLVEDMPQVAAMFTNMSNTPHEKYIMEVEERFVLTQADEGGFWWIGNGRKRSICNK
ncbi:uncharacterized protein LOC121870729 isoform X2 [Homarus americanus]|uniref:uncharacterized protein LOC121870729 isoform X2 n=1 Tax=Homarus americanus TaxID=6706 RepID=UPI001C46AD85|nr:uncharacterized protein LOC121870729 isoform X2 [Homarus americanus]